MTANRTNVKSFTKEQFRVETMRGKGPGGQKRNVTDSCVRITHMETGLSAYNCDTPSQHRNKDAAFRQLAKQLIDHYFPKHDRTREAAGSVVIRSYKQDEDLVVDDQGYKASFREVVKGKLNEMIFQRKKRLKENND